MSMFTINLAWPMCEKHALCVGSMPCVLETCSVCGKHAPCVRNMPHVWETCPEFGKQAPCVGNMTLCGKHALCVENDAPCVGNMPHVWQTCPMCGKHAQCVGNMNWVHVMSRMCKVSNFSSLWYQEPHQRHPCPPSPGWILGGHGFPEPQIWSGMSSTTHLSKVKDRSVLTRRMDTWHSQ